MKLLTLRVLPLLVGAIFCFSACGDDDAADDTTSTTDSSTVSTSAPATPASTIVTTPQYMMVATHKVADFDKWLASYEANDSLRQANGIRSYVIGRSTKDPNTILVATKTDDPEKAKAFAKSAALKQAMQKGGVIGTPKVEVTTMVWQDTGQISTDLRSRSTFTVKEWARWQRAFDSTRQSGYDNGLAIRAYGHEADNDKKVTVVSAVLDSAKAAAYWKSDTLKQRRSISGAGEPDRFIFRVVKRY